MGQKKRCYNNVRVLILVYCNQMQVQYGGCKAKNNTPRDWNFGGWIEVYSLKKPNKLRAKKYWTLFKLIANT